MPSHSIPGLDLAVHPARDDAVRAREERVDRAAVREDRLDAVSAGPDVELAAHLCSTAQHSTAQYSTVQHSTVQYITLHYAWQQSLRGTVATR